MSRVATYEMSCRNDAALQHFDKALDAFQTYLGNPIEHLERALTEEPDFVMAHLFRAIALALTSERRHLKDARASLEVAESLVARANDREKALLHAVRPLLAGDWDEACRRFDRVLAVYPTDALTLQAAHLLDFLRGDALNLRNRVARVLPRWSASMPGYSFVLGFYAFGLEECNQYPEAEDAGRRAVELDRRDGWAVHAVTHVMEMQGRVAEGIEWLERRQNDWAPRHGPANEFAYHNWWHLALFHLDRGDADRALALLDQEITPGVADVSMGLLDVTSMLWRLRLFGVPVGDRFSALAEKWRAKLGEEAGYYAFNDFHAALTFAAAGDRDALEETRAAMRRAAETDTGTNGPMAAQVGAPLLDALVDYVEERYGPAAERLASVRDIAQRFGGSHAQRDLLTLTLIDAAQRAGDKATARHYLNERLASKPSSGLGWRLLAKAL
ncbi:MAG TPA: tetratricopeptide repeat protein [Pseudomonadales bacterium]